MANLLVSSGKTISLAESCTGGLITERLTDLPGSSRFMHSAVVAYSNEAKEKFLGVDEHLINKYGAVSEEVAVAMAKGILTATESDLALAVTGIAGPGGGSEDKPVGLVYVALVAAVSPGKEPLSFVRKLLLGSRINRSEVRYRTANEALNMVRLFLLEPSSL
ncbi:MAG: Nicotinamide-nucleotide amidohydrolase PncC [bacterium ADurb.Bin425]|nr:MAG: Nicotinamide-nucleotide amidohydrolase PncC [bacterium ADurb.Bin425]